MHRIEITIEDVEDGIALELDGIPPDLTEDDVTSALRAAGIIIGTIEDMGVLRPVDPLDKDEH